MWIKFLFLFCFSFALANVEDFPRFWKIPSQVSSPTLAMGGGTLGLWGQVTLPSEWTLGLQPFSYPYYLYGKIEKVAHHDSFLSMRTGLYVWNISSRSFEVMENKEEIRDNLTFSVFSYQLEFKISENIGWTPTLLYFHSFSSKVQIEGTLLGNAFYVILNSKIMFYGVFLVAIEPLTLNTPEASFASIPFFHEEGSYAYGLYVDVNFYKNFLLSAGIYYDKAFLKMFPVLELSYVF